MKTGKYSKFSTFSLKKRCYLIQAQKDTPILDSELREMSQVPVELVNWLARNSYGDVAVLSWDRTSPDGTGASISNRNTAFGCGPVNASAQMALENRSNFRVFGGRNNNGTNDMPAVMYLKGWYVFLDEDILFTDQSEDLVSHSTLDVLKETVGESLPNANSSEEEKRKYSLRSATFNKNTSVFLSAGSEGQVDVIYLKITFDEVVGNGDPTKQYVDPSLIDPAIGGASANRVRATLNICVQQGWAKPITKYDELYKDTFFSDSVGVDGTRCIKAPIAVYKYPQGMDTSYYFAKGFIDILGLCDKRVLPPVELSYMAHHGGYTKRDVEAGRCDLSDVDETWDAEGQNKGFGTDAFNSESVTPRVLQKDGQFKMKSMVVGDSNSTSITEDPEELCAGEQVAVVSFVENSFIRGNKTNNLKQAREWLTNALQVIDITGTDNPGQEWHTSAIKLGDSGKYAKGSAWLQKYHSKEYMTSEVVSELNYEGHLGLGASANSTYVLYVKGPSSLEGRLQLSGDLDVGGKTTLNDGTNINGTLTVDKSVTLKDTLRVEKDVILGSGLTVNGDTAIGGTLSVTKDFKVSGYITLVGEGTIKGQVEFEKQPTFGGSKLVTKNELTTEVTEIKQTITNQVTTVNEKSLRREGGPSVNSVDNTMLGDIVFADPGIGKSIGLVGTIGDNDHWSIKGFANLTDGGCLEIATGDNGSEPIYVRQYANGNGDGSPTKQITLMSSTGRTFLRGLTIEGVDNPNLVVDGKSEFNAPSLFKGTVTVKHVATFEMGFNLKGSLCICSPDQPPSNGDAGDVLTATGDSDLPPRWKNPKNMAVDSWGLLSSALRKQLGKMVTGHLIATYMGWTGSTNYKVVDRVEGPSGNVVRDIRSTQHRDLNKADTTGGYHYGARVVGYGYLRYIQIHATLYNIQKEGITLEVSIWDGDSRRLWTKRGCALNRSRADTTSWLCDITDEIDSKYLLANAAPLKILFETVGNLKEYTSYLLAYDVNLVLTASPKDTEIS